MNTITQDMKFRQALIEYSLKYGVTKAPYATKPIDNMFIAGESVMTAQYTRLLPFVGAGLQSPCEIFL